MGSGLLEESTLIWNSFIRAYSKSPNPRQAIALYNYLTVSSSLTPDHHTFPAILKACTHYSSLPKGKEIHGHVTKVGLTHDIFVQNSLINMYGTLLEINDARRLFDKMTQRDLTTWNSILKAYICTPGFCREVYVLFREMRHDNIAADEITLVTLLSGCERTEFYHGRILHACVLKHGFLLVGKVGNLMMDIYAGRGDMAAAFRLFLEMKVRDIASHTILINGYMKMGSLDTARAIFDGMCFKDLVVWNSMVNGYVKAERLKEAFEIFKQMEAEMVTPDEITMISLLSACGRLTDLQLGRSVHQFIRRHCIKEDMFLGTALVDMYAKCGSLMDATLTFYKMDVKDVYTWTALISGFAKHGDGQEALRLFTQMRKEGVTPTEATFVSVLVACSHAGLVDEGRHWFDEMVGVYKIQPNIEHLACSVDLLSRAGLLCEAKELIRKIPIQERVIPCKTLLGACVSYGDTKIGEKVANELIEMDTKSHGVYVLLSNFYAFANRWDDVEKMRKIIRRMDIRKEAGTSNVKEEELF
ncbi:pentatricopeptide repeat-containing protein At2g22410, mitochondrial-like [Typha latifolia]|uniref:pentatricopeptide repeat-containing protein At2g22410, mitochondrial-like n=1 Tax=Typha latifolia TaxID=4733 RepID=UPI003C2F3C5B